MSEKPRDQNRRPSNTADDAADAREQSGAKNGTPNPRGYQEQQGAQGGGASEQSRAHGVAGFGGGYGAEHQGSADPQQNNQDTYGRQGGYGGQVAYGQPQSGFKPNHVRQSAGSDQNSSAQAGGFHPGQQGYSDQHGEAGFGEGTPSAGAGQGGLGQTSLDQGAQRDGPPALSHSGRSDSSESAKKSKKD